MSNADLRRAFPDEVTKLFFEAPAEAIRLGYEDRISVLEDLGRYTRSLGTLPVVEEN